MELDAAERHWRLFHQHGRENWPWAIWVLSPDRINAYLHVEFATERWDEILNLFDSVAYDALLNDSTDFIKFLPAGVWRKGELDACRRLLAIVPGDWDRIAYAPVLRPSPVDGSVRQKSTDPIQLLIHYLHYLEGERDAWTVPFREWQLAADDFELCRSFALAETASVKVHKLPIRVIDIPKSYRGLAIHKPRGSRMTPAASVSAWRANLLLSEVNTTFRTNTSVLLESGTTLEQNPIFRLLAAPSPESLRAASTFADILFVRSVNSSKGSGKDINEKTNVEKTIKGTLVKTGPGREIIRAGETTTFEEAAAAAIGIVTDAVHIVQNYRQERWWIDDGYLTVPALKFGDFLQEVSETDKMVHAVATQLIDAKRDDQPVRFGCRVERTAHQVAVKFADRVGYLLYSNLWTEGPEGPTGTGLGGWPKNGLMSDGQLIEFQQRWRNIRDDLAKVELGNLDEIIAVIKLEAQRAVTKSKANEVKPIGGGLLATGEGTASKATKPVRRKRGPKPRYAPKEDREVWDAWQTGSYQTHYELAGEKGMKVVDVKKALDRERKRREKSLRKTGQG